QLAGHRRVHHPEIVLHVRKGDGLRAIFGQAYAYGAGDKLLRHGYADVAAAFRNRDERRAAEAAAPVHALPPGADVEEPPAGRVTRALASAGRVLRKAARVRGRRDLADRVQREAKGGGEGSGGSRG